MLKESGSFFFYEKTRDAEDDAVTARRVTNFPLHHRQPATVHLICPVKL